MIRWLHSALQGGWLASSAAGKNTLAPSVHVTPGKDDPREKGPATDPVSVSQSPAQQATGVVEIRTPDHCVGLSTEECWQLYVMLGDSAPFVRHRLSVIRRGGTGAVSLSTPDECREVLQVLATEGNGALSEGLQLLQTVLTEERAPTRSAKRTRV